MTRQKRTARTRAVQAGRRIFRRWMRWTPDLTLTVLRTQQAMRDELVREGMRAEPTGGS